jgi:hypothetical protein
MIFAVPNYERQRFTVVDYGGEGRREQFKQSLALLATGLDSEKTDACIHELAWEGGAHTEGSDTYTLIPAMLHDLNGWKVRGDITEAFREHRITAAQAISETGLVSRIIDWDFQPQYKASERSPSLQFLTELGLFIDPISAADADSHEPEFNLVSDAEDALAVKVAQGLDLTHTAVQFELAYDEETHSYSMPSQRSHTSLGTMVGDVYNPVVTVLNEEHPVRQAVEQQATA